MPPRLITPSVIDQWRFNLFFMSMRCAGENIAPRLLYIINSTIPLRRKLDENPV